MRKATFLFICLIFNVRLYSQNIYYSPIENNEPSKTATFVIGEVNNKLLIWKDDRQTHISTLLIYNDQMEILGRVKEKLAGNNIISSLKFLKTATGFSVIYEYNTSKNEYFCKQNNYDENGMQVDTTKIIQQIKLKDDGSTRISYLRMLSSEQKRQTILYRQFITTNLDSTIIEYTHINEKDPPNFKLIVIPLHSKGQLTGVTLDEYGNILLGETYPSPDSTGCTLTIYKQTAGTDSLTIFKQKLQGKFLWETKLIADINSEGYIVHGIVTDKPISKENKYHPTGLFTELINLNLTTKFEPQVTDFSSLARMPNYDNLQIKKAIPTPDGGYYLYFINNDLYGVNIIRPYTETLGFRQVSVAPISNIIPSGYRFANYGYREEYILAQQNFMTPRRIYIIPPSRSEVKEQLKAMSLIVFKFNGKNELESGGVIKGDAESGFISRVDMSASFRFDNDLHFIYPKEIDEKKQVLGEISFDASGKSKAINLIANRIKFIHRTTGAVKINEHSIVFEYDNNYRFGFARINY